MQVITLLAGDANLLALNGGLNLKLGILNVSHDFLRQLFIDAFLELKVQAAIQGEQVRITGKKRDDLQEAIAALRAKTFDMPLQFNNFRD